MNDRPLLNAYAVLALPNPPHSQSLTKDNIRKAYHKALLEYHPDKSGQLGNDLSRSHGTPDIDSITEAYRILTSPNRRAQLDKRILLLPKQLAKNDNANGTEFEVIDLGDMHYNAEDGAWSYPCRCGVKMGYLVSHTELEEDTVTIGQQLEILLSCSGCSLCLNVLYEVAPD